LREDDIEYLTETIYPGLSVRLRVRQSLQTIRQFTENQGEHTQNLNLTCGQPRSK
jgi:hypothetical protein